MGHVSFCHRLRPISYYVILLNLTVRHGGSWFFVPLGQLLRADMLLCVLEVSVRSIVFHKVGQNGDVQVLVQSLYWNRFFILR